MNTLSCRTSAEGGSMKYVLTTEGRGRGGLTLLRLGLSVFQFGNSRLAAFMSPNSLSHLGLSFLSQLTSAHYVILQDQGLVLLLFVYVSVFNIGDAHLVSHNKAQRCLGSRVLAASFHRTGPLSCSFGCLWLKIDSMGPLYPLCFPPHPLPHHQLLGFG